MKHAPYYVVAPEWMIGKEEFERQIAIIEKIERQRRASSFTLYCIGLAVICAELFGVWAHLQVQIIEESCAVVRGASGAPGR